MSMHDLAAFAGGLLGALVALFVALTVFQGCSATLPDDDCPIVVNSGWEFHYCQDGIDTWSLFTDEAWREAEALDLILDELGQDTFRDELVGARVEIHDRPAGSRLAGYFNGYHDRDSWAVVLFIDPDDPYPPASRTALAHELWHGYEKNVYGVTLYDVQQSPGHFVFDETARAVLGAAHDDTGCGFFETYWEG